jgi:hypothetical protein
MTAPDVAACKPDVPDRSQTGMPAVPCEGGWRCHCPRGHAAAAVRISFSPADGDATWLRLLCAGCADAMEAVFGHRGMITRRSL